MNTRFQIRPLTRQARLLDCGHPDLDNYFARMARQDQEKGASSCFVASEVATEVTAGFYTLSACHVQLERLSPDIQNHLPRYAEVPGARIGRLAVDRQFQGTGLGRFLFVDAIRKVLQSEIAVALAVVDAKNNEAAAFYARFGFSPLPDFPLVLVAATRMLRKAFPKTN